MRCSAALESALTAGVMYLEDRTIGLEDTENLVSYKNALATQSPAGGTFRPVERTSDDLDLSDTV